MEITEVRITVKPERMLRGFATITIDNCLAIEHVRILEGPNGLFIAMPSKKLPNGTYKDVVHPINAETRRMMEERVIAEYKKVTDRNL